MFGQPTHALVYISWSPCFSSIKSERHSLCIQLNMCRDHAHFHLEFTDWYVWAPAGMNRGERALWKSWKLAVRVKRSVDHLFMHHFHNFSSARHFWTGEIWRVSECVLRATTKKGQLFWGKKCTPERKSWLCL